MANFYTNAWKKQPVLMGIGHLALGYFAYTKLTDAAAKRKGIKEVTKYQKASVKSAQGASINIIETAKQLGLDLGVAYSWWNPQSWTENDNAAKALILQIPKDLIPVVAREYAALYPGRSLYSDVQNYLDDYSEVRHLFI